MNENAQGALIIWHDMPPEHRADMLAWYDHEHHAERVAIEGFLSVRRYHAIDAARALFIHYDIVGPQALTSNAYLERVNTPTDRSLRYQPMIRNNSRTACAVVARHGSARGGFALTIGFSRDLWDSQGDLIDQAALWNLLSRRPGLLSLEIFSADPAASSLPSTEKKLRGADDRHAGGVLVLHATNAEALLQARADTDADKRFHALREAETGLFQLAFCLAK